MCQYESEQKFCGTERDQPANDARRRCFATGIAKARVVSALLCLLTRTVSRTADKRLALLDRPFVRRS